MQDILKRSDLNEMVDYGKEYTRVRCTDLVQSTYNHTKSTCTAVAHD